MSSKLPADEVDQLRDFARASSIVSTILGRWADIGLPDCWLVAGAVAQTVWNRAFGLPAGHGIVDADVVYFDAEDLSEETEAAHAARVRRLFADLPVWLDVKNEARVHLWYEGKFGRAIPPYVSTADAVSTFPTTATAVGLEPAGREVVVLAPYGLADLLGLIVRPNRKQITQAIYEAKVARWIALWPKLDVVPWDEVGR